MNPKLTKKEQGLIKGALRRIFSRSDLRKQVLELSALKGFLDARRPRVKKWSRCQRCLEIVPQYLMEVDHVEPVVPVGSSLSDMTVDRLIDNIWCTKSNLQVICKVCHKIKTLAEAKERRMLKKKRGI